MSGLNGEYDGMSNNQAGWPSAAVAIAILAMIGAVTIAAITSDYTLSETLQIWQAMTAIIGLVTGAFVTYFFTRSAVDTAQGQAHGAMQLAAQEARRADATQQALTKAVGLLQPEQWSALQEDPAFRLATPMNGDGVASGLFTTR